MLDLKELEALLALALRAASEAGALAITQQAKATRVPSRKDFLASIDLDAERLILDRLSLHPEISILTEESGGERASSGLQWVIDPIDGSLNYFLQYSSWGTSIALLEDGRPVLGVINFPAKCRTLTAMYGIAEVRSLGRRWAMMPRETQRPQADLSDWQVRVAWGKEEHSGADGDRVCEILKLLHRRSKYPRISNCAIDDLRAVAFGQSIGFIFLKPEPYDIAAGCQVVEAAGGKVTDLLGAPWTPFSQGIIASNGGVHSELLSIVKEAGYK